MTEYKIKYRNWCENVSSDDPMFAELAAISSDEETIKERFLPDITFGTAGLRGKLHLGSNCMNFYTVGRATQGIADYIKKFGKEACDRGVVIAHDPRHFSKEFSDFAADILSANGIKVYVFDDLRPTPQLAYLIRVLKTISGINITASHNPKDYNGYKVYWEDGCQVGSDIANGMLECINAVNLFDKNRVPGKVKGVKPEFITVLGPEYDRMYLDAIEGMKIHDGDELQLDIPLVYTPLNGAGAKPFTQMMKDRGFTNWHMVEEQRNPDPDFSTVGYPNPESPAAFKMAEELGKKVGAEILLATDPDADRFAIEILGANGKYIPLNGNQTGYLLVYYILEGMKSAGTLPENAAIVKSIVTGTLSVEMAVSYGVKVSESLTGFKNICGRIPELEANGYKYIFGYEESVGYAACPDIRDKDGISAGMLIAEAAAFFKKQGKTLFDVLEEIYTRYGYFVEDEPNLILEGLEGAARIKRMMESVRNNLPKEIAGIKVEKVLDYKDGLYDSYTEDSFEPSNVLRFMLANGSWFAIRPSGTEPKIKFYFYSKQDSRAKALEVNEKIKNAVMRIVQAVE